MPKQITWLRRARLDFFRASDYFKSVSPELQDRFENEVDQSLERIAADPERWKIVDRGARKYLTPVFKYRIFYLNVETIRIVAVAHSRRHPDFWKKRILDDEQR